MKIRYQRLLLILFSLVFLTSSILLILFNSKKNLIFFYTPTEYINSNSKINNIVRIGGIVEINSIINLGKNNYEFIISDNKNFINISYEGLLPDLFKEGQGAVIEGTIFKKKLIKASKVFAKHDENYMPENIKKQLENNQYWQTKYK